MVFCSGHSTIFDLSYPNLYSSYPSTYRQSPSIFHYHIILSIDINIDNYKSLSSSTIFQWFDSIISIEFLLSEHIYQAILSYWSIHNGNIACWIYAFLRRFNETNYDISMQQNRFLDTDNHWNGWRNCCNDAGKSRQHSGCPVGCTVFFNSKNILDTWIMLDNVRNTEQLWRYSQ